MKKFLIPLATAIASLLSHHHSAAAAYPTADSSQSVPTLVEPEPGLRFNSSISKSIASLILAKTPLSIQMASHRSHRSHTSHRSHRSGR